MYRVESSVTFSNVMAKMQLYNTGFDRCYSNLLSGVSMVFSNFKNITLKSVYTLPSL